MLRSCGCSFCSLPSEQQSREKEFASPLVMDCIKNMMDGLDPRVLTGLTVVGGLAVARCALSVLGSLFMSFLRPGKNLAKFGSWAVVTGATGKPSSWKQH